MFYVSRLVITKQKPTVDSQKIKRSESMHTTTENHQFTKEGSKRGRNLEWFPETQEVEN